MPQVVSDNATPSDIEPEPVGFWKNVHAQVRAWAEQYGNEDVVKPD